MAQFKRCRYCGKMISIDSTDHQCKQMLAHKQEINKRKEEYQKKVAVSDKPIHTRKWRALRKKIIIEDGGFCQRCWYKYHIINYDNPEVHHIIPRIDHPEMAFDENNLITVCHACNTQLGTDAKLDFDWSPEMRRYKGINDYGDHDSFFAV